MSENGTVTKVLKSDFLRIIAMKYFPLISIHTTLRILLNLYKIQNSSFE